MPSCKTTIGLEKKYIYNVSYGVYIENNFKIVFLLNLQKYAEFQEVNVNILCIMENNGQDGSNAIKQEPSKEEERGNQTNEDSVKTKVEDEDTVERLEIKVEPDFWLESDDLVPDDLLTQEKIHCDMCDYAAIKSSHLKRHKQAKHGELAFKCDQCDYKATLKDYLYKHKRAKHKLENDRPLNFEGVCHMCDQCDYRTKKKSSLLRHKQTKHEKATYICDQCDYKANQEHNLLIHKESKHEGVTYDCDQCEYRAPRKDSLIRHKQGKHEGVKYECGYCDYKASWPIDLTRHVQAKHKESSTLWPDQEHFLANMSPTFPIVLPPQPTDSG